MNLNMRPIYIFVLCCSSFHIIRRINSSRRSGKIRDIYLLYICDRFMFQFGLHSALSFSTDHYFRYRTP